MKVRTLVTTLAVVLVPAAFSCSDPGSETRIQQVALERGERIGSEEMGPSQRPAAAPLGPAEIADIVLVVNMGEVAQARLAEQRARNEHVREFARRMREDHGQALQRMRQLMGGETRGRMQMPRDPSARLMARQGELITKDLESQQEEMFDLAYMTTQIGAHAKALGLLERVLIPAMQQGGRHEQQDYPLEPRNEEGARREGEDPLLRELMKLREDVGRHLDRAVQIHAEVRASMQQQQPPGQMGGGENQQEEPRQQEEPQ